MVNQQFKTYSTNTKTKKQTGTRNKLFSSLLSLLLPRSRYCHGTTGETVPPDHRIEGGLSKSKLFPELCSEHFEQW